MTLKEEAVRISKIRDAFIGFANQCPESVQDVDRAISILSRLVSALEEVGQGLEFHVNPLPREITEELQIVHDALTFTLTDIWLILGRMASSPRELTPLDYQQAWEEINTLCVCVDGQSLSVLLEHYQRFLELLVAIISRLNRTVRHTRFSLMFECKPEEKDQAEFNRLRSRLLEVRVLQTIRALENADGHITAVDTSHFEMTRPAVDVVGSKPLNRQLLSLTESPSNSEIGDSEISIWASNRLTSTISPTATLSYASQIHGVPNADKEYTHWATKVFKNISSTQLPRSSEKTRYHEKSRLPESELPGPDYEAVLRLSSLEAIQFTLYCRLSDYRAKIVVCYHDHGGQSAYACKTLEDLFLQQTGPLITIWGTKWSGVSRPWATIKFTTIERLVLFASTFFAMKFQSSIRSKASIVDDELLDEVLEYDGVITESGFTHALRISRDKMSGAVRLEGSEVVGGSIGIPKWTAFITHSLMSPAWCSRIGETTVILKELNAHIFSHLYLPHLASDGAFELRFNLESDAEDFVYVINDLRSRSVDSVPAGSHRQSLLKSENTYDIEGRHSTASPPLFVQEYHKPQIVDGTSPEHSDAISTDSRIEVRRYRPKAPAQPQNQPDTFIGVLSSQKLDLGENLTSLNLVSNTLISDQPGLTDGPTNESGSVLTQTETPTPERRQETIERQAPRTRNEGFPPADEGEIQVVISRDEDMQSQRSVQRPREVMLAENHLATTFASDKKVADLCKQALKVMVKARLIDNLRRLLKDYYLSLLSLAGSSLQRNAVELLRRRQARTRIAQMIVDHVEPESENRNWLFQQQTDDSSQTIEDWITSIFPIGEDLADPPMVHHLESDNSSSEEESDEENNAVHLPNLIHLTAFFKESLPFHQLLSNIQLFLIPPMLRSLTRVLMTIPTERVTFKHVYRQDLGHRVKARMQKLSQHEWDWWPLSQCQTNLPPDHSRIYWQCHCNKMLWHDVTIPQADQLQTLLRLRGPYLWTNHLCRKRKVCTWLLSNPFSKLTDQTNASSSWRATDALTNESPVPSQTTFASNSSSGSKDSVASAGSASSAVALSGSDTSASGLNSSLTTISQHTSSTAIPVVDSNLSYITYGVSARSELKIDHLCTIKQAPNDGVLFSLLQSNYVDVIGIWKALFSIWQLSHYDFVKFEKWQAGQVLSRGYGLPDSLDYVYSPRPPHAENPPILPHEFQQRFTSCRTTWVSRFRRHCSCNTDEKTALALIPKRSSMWNYKAKTPQREHAWGLKAEERISFIRVFIYTILILVGPFAFWAAWQGVHPQDMQNASIPATFAIGLLSFLWTWAGVIKVYNNQNRA